MTSGPWENDNGGNSNNPWGEPPRSAGRKPGDMDDALRQARERFKNKIRGGGESPGMMIFFGIVLIVAIWFGTGFYRVEPEENAAIMTFGKLTSTRGEPGLGYHLPYPIQEAIKINVAFDRRIEMGFRGQAADRAGTVPAESMMLTGDENIIDINFVVLWRISDAGKYLFNIRDPETTIRKVAESAMRETIGRTEIQKALTEGRSDIEVKTKELMQKILDEYASGVVINSVQLLRVDPPAPVVDAFDDVQRARTDLERLKNEAQTYRNDIVPRARGEAQKLLQDAEAYKMAVTSKAQGDASRFNSVYEAYKQSKDVTQRRIYLETMQEIMKSSRKIIVGDQGGAPVLPYMNIDQMQKNSAQRSGGEKQ
jgi:membrane protease subunit HflK